MPGSDKLARGWCRDWVMYLGNPFGPTIEFSIFFVDFAFYAHLSGIAQQNCYEQKKVLNEDPGMYMYMYM